MIASGVIGRGIFAADLLSGVGLQAAQALDGRLDVLDRPAELLADLRIAVHLQVFEMLGDQRPLQLKIMACGPFRVLLPDASS